MIIKNYSTISFLIVAVIAVITPLASARLSITADGSWLKAVGSECEHFLCSPSNLTWKYESTPQHFEYPHVRYNRASACAGLQQHGISQIFLYGDSYLRHIYTALLIIFNDDYRWGAVRKNADQTVDASVTSQYPDCDFRNQFRCNKAILDRKGVVCGGNVTMQYIFDGLRDLSVCNSTAAAGSGNTIVLLSMGNHGLVRHSRIGVNNAAMHQEVFRRGVCNDLLHFSSHSTDGGNAIAASTGLCSVWWVSTHHRVKAVYVEDENADYVARYNLQTRQFFDSGSCGLVNYLDVFNFTAQLVRNHFEDAQRLTLDGMHWGMEVNMIKAQFLLHALIAGRS